MRLSGPPSAPTWESVGKLSGNHPTVPTVSTQNCHNCRVPTRQFPDRYSNSTEKEPRFKIEKLSGYKGVFYIPSKTTQNAPNTYL